MVSSPKEPQKGAKFPSAKRRRLGRSQLGIASALTLVCVMLNLAFGGDNGGDPAGITFPVKYEVDYVRVFQKM
jgi:hypothetical protein